MAEVPPAMPFAKNQRWSFLSDQKIFEHELVIVAVDREALPQPIYTVAIAFDSRWSLDDLYGLVLQITESSLRDSVKEMTDADSSVWFWYLEGRFPAEFTVPTDGVVLVPLVRETVANALREVWRRVVTFRRALRAGDVESVRQFLAKDPRRVALPVDEHDGSLPLHEATAFGHVDVIEILLQHGAGVNAWRGDGWTPLHCAAASNRADAVALLLDHGADIAAHDQVGYTPIYLATRNSASEAAWRLEQNGAPLDLHSLVRLGHVSEAQNWIQSDTSAFEQALDRDTLLEDVIYYLGVKPHDGYQSASDDTASRALAALLPVVACLLDQGADPTTGLRYALKLQGTGILRLLLERGGDPNKDVEHGAYLDACSERKDMRAVLKEFGARGYADPDIAIPHFTELLQDSPEDADAPAQACGKLAASRPVPASTGGLRGDHGPETARPRRLRRRCAMIAACPDDSFRDADKARQLARKAIRRDAEPSLMRDIPYNMLFLGYQSCAREAAAIALADQGAFERAAADVEDFLPQTSPLDRKRLQDQQKLYEQKTPYRHPSVIPELLALGVQLAATTPSIPKSSTARKRQRIDERFPIDADGKLTVEFERPTTRVCARFSPRNASMNSPNSISVCPLTWTARGSSSILSRDRDSARFRFDGESTRALMDFPTGMKLALSSRVQRAGTRSRSSASAIVDSATTSPKHSPTQRC